MTDAATTTAGLANVPAPEDHSTRTPDALTAAARQAGARPSLLPMAMIGLGLMLVEDPQPPDSLERICEMSVELLDACDAATVTYGLDDGWTSRAGSEPAALRVDTSQYDAGRGPCLDTARDGRVRRVVVGDGPPQWEEFARTAQAEGFTTVLAVPLLAVDRCVGSLNLFGRGPEPLAALDEAVALMFAQHAAVVLTSTTEKQAALRRADELEQAMRSRAVIEQAKGALAALDGGDPAGAFERLREASNRTNTKLRDVASEVVGRVSRGQDPWHQVEGVEHP